MLPWFEMTNLHALREGDQLSWSLPVSWRCSLPGKPAVLRRPSWPRPSLWGAQLLAAAVTCLGLANRWPWVSGTVPISNVLSRCQTNVLLFSS